MIDSDLTFEDIPQYYENAEVRKAVAEAVLSLCDAVELFYETDEDDFDVYDLYGTVHEDIIPAFIGKQHSESWGMFGYAFLFAATEALKSRIKKIGLDGVFENGKRILFQNITLYRGNKMLFTCCSHELHYWTNLVTFDEEIAPIVLNAAKNAISN